MIKVLLADNHPLILAGIRSALSLEKEIEVVGDAANGQETLDLCRCLFPDILLLDFVMPGPASFQIIHDLKHNRSTASIKVILLSASEEDTSSLPELIDLGIKGIVFKDEPILSIGLALKQVDRGGKWFSYQVTEQLVLRMRGARNKLDSKRASLTDREMDIIQLLCRGLSNAEIAEQLVVAERTVRFHMENVLQKLEVNNRTEAVVKVVQEGWVRLEAAPRQ